METRQNNPFDGLDIRYSKARYGDGSIKQKAFFEHGSYESELIPYEDRINTMSRFVLEGYDMHKLVDNYLDEKDALNDDRRKIDIAYTFEFYASTVAFKFLDGFKGTEPISENLKLLLRQFFKTDTYLLDKGEELQRRISVFVNWVKEIGTSRERTYGGWPKKC